MSESYTNYPAPATKEDSLRSVMASPFREVPRSTAVNRSDPADEARLLTKVYTELGFFDPTLAEKAPEILTGHIADLRTSHPETDLQSLIAVRLVPEFGFRALIAHFDIGQNVSTFVWPDLWKHYENDLPMLKRRSIGGKNDPADLEVVGMPLKVDNDYGEAGLTMTDMTLEKQRNAIGDGMVASIIDGLL